MVDKRTKAGKAALTERDNLSARELAANAALARFGNATTTSPIIHPEPRVLERMGRTSYIADCVIIGAPIVNLVATN